MYMISLKLILLILCTIEFLCTGADKKSCLYNVSDKREYLSFEKIFNLKVENWIKKV